MMKPHRITEAELADRLQRAAAWAVDYTRTMVRQPLPSARLFLIAPNQSYDGNALEDDEALFPADSLKGQRLGPLSAQDAASWLWRDGKIPEWINLRVYDADESASYLLLECCGRFTAMLKHLYHRAEGYQPLHVTSPVLPPGWESVDEHGRFDLEARRGAG